MSSTTTLQGSHSSGRPLGGGEKVFGIFSRFALAEGRFTEETEGLNALPRSRQIRVERRLLDEQIDRQRIRGRAATGE